MPKLLLHIGTHKTGTTSIQRFCGANRDALRKSGIWYPPADIGPFPSHYAHHRIAHAIAGRDADFDAGDARTFFERVRKQAGRDETVLISAEPMYRHMLPDPYPDGGPAKLGDVERGTRLTAYAAAVSDLLLDFDVTVMVMLRRQDKFVESLYAEQVLASGYNRPIERFLAERGWMLDYESRLSAWSAAFGEDSIAVMAFEPSRFDAPIEHVFIEWAGAAWDDVFQIDQRHNVTPSRTLVEFKRLINEPGQSAAVGNRIRRWIEQFAGDIDGRGLPDIGRDYLQPVDRMSLLADYTVGNRAVAERYLDGDELFAEDPVRELERYADRRELTANDVAAIMGRLLRGLADGTID